MNENLKTADTVCYIYCNHPINSYFTHKTFGFKGSQLSTHIDFRHFAKSLIPHS